MRFLKSLYSFGGRTNRKTCWLTGVGILAAAVAAAAAGSFSGHLMRQAGLEPQHIGVPYFHVVPELVALPAMIVLCALLPLYVRRLHDRDRTGHWIWVGALLTLTGSVFVSLFSEYVDPSSNGSWVLREPLAAAKYAVASFAFGIPVAWLHVAYDSLARAAATSFASDFYPHAIVGTISVVFGVWLIVELGFLRGTVGPNKYGPDPLQSS